MGYWNNANYVKIDSNYQFGHLTMPTLPQNVGNDIDLGQILANTMYMGFNIATNVLDSDNEKSPEDIKAEITKLEGELSNVLKSIGNSTTLEEAWKYYQDINTAKDANTKIISDNVEKMTNNTTQINNNREIIRNNTESIQRLNNNITNLNRDLEALNNPKDEDGKPRDLTPEESTRKDMLEQEIELAKEEIRTKKEQNSTLETQNETLQNNTDTLQEQNNTLKKQLDELPDTNILKKNYDDAVKIQNKINRLENKAKNTSVPGQTSNLSTFNNAYKEWQTASASGDDSKKKKAAQNLKDAYEAFGEYASSNVKYLYEQNQTAIKAALASK